jgi:hypothetical protein
LIGGFVVGIVGDLVLGKLEILVVLLIIYRELVDHLQGETKQEESSSFSFLFMKLQELPQRVVDALEQSKEFGEFKQALMKR